VPKRPFRVGDASEGFFNIRAVARTLSAATRGLEQSARAEEAKALKRGERGSSATWVCRFRADWQCNLNLHHGSHSPALAAVFNVLSGRMEEAVGWATIYRLRPRDSKQLRAETLRKFSAP
jgi:hypothetical protein